MGKEISKRAYGRENEAREKKWRKGTAEEEERGKCMEKKKDNWIERRRKEGEKDILKIKCGKEIEKLKKKMEIVKERKWRRGCEREGGQ